MRTLSGPARIIQREQNSAVIADVPNSAVALVQPRATLCGGYLNMVRVLMAAVRDAK